MPRWIELFSLSVAILFSLLLLSEAIISKWFLLAGVIACVLLAIAQYILYRLQPFGYMAACSIFTSAYLSRWNYDIWVAKHYVIQPIIILRIFYFLFLFIGLYLVFVYYRAVTAFQQKRGNVEKEQVVHYIEPLSERLKKLFQRKKEEPIQDVYIPIGVIPDERKK